MSGSSSITTAMSRWLPVGYGCAPPSGSISIMRTSLATSRTARTRAGWKWLSAIDRDQRRPGQLRQRALARERYVEVAPRDARMLAGERLRACALPLLDRLQHPPVLCLGDIENAMGLRELGLDEHERARRR